MREYVFFPWYFFHSFQTQLTVSLLIDGNQRKPLETLKTKSFWELQKLQNQNPQNKKK